MRHLRAWRDWRQWVPAECPGCDRRQRGQGLCAACRAALAWNPAIPGCRICLHPLVAGVCPDCPPGGVAYEQIVAAFAYAGLGRTLIHDYKIRCRLSLAAVLADHLAQAVQRAGVLQAPPDWIVPVPARRQGVRDRGFSPAAEIARLLARRLGLAYCLDGVRRHHDGTKQADLGRDRRLQAQMGLYVCDATDIQGGLLSRYRRAIPLSGARVAVVDDVLTTGATMQAVATALKAAGVVQVQGWVLGRTVLPGSRFTIQPTEALSYTHV
ncbi:ComF family protein [Castellaniella sp.]|uniref:ComF family protein n=1 Tax=Castellaniella sp. TaxID=1955812 RepID=UPI002AFFABBD|nr:phosphoribosyltransferase family protein [Castellaniella sp.]